MIFNSRFLAVVLGALTLSSGVAFAEELPEDPDLVVGELDNGMRYVIKRHAQPPGRSMVWLHVATGSLNETDKQRGIAHFFEHLAFNGSENFPPGTAVKFFESLGMSFGADLNAHTTFDETVYKLTVKEASPEMVGEALVFLGDVAYGLTLASEEIEAERGVILEEMRTSLGPEQRVMDKLWTRLAPGSIFGERLPIGIEQTLLTMQREDFVDYYETWYVPTNMTVMVVGDLDPQDVVPVIEEKMNRGERADRPSNQAVGITPYSEARSVVITDPELASAQVQIYRIGAPEGPTTDTKAYRSDLVNSMTTIMMNRKLEASVAAGDVSFREAGVFATELGGAMTLVGGVAVGEADEWTDMLTDLGRELQRARIHGFTDQEIEDARTELMSQYAMLAQQADTLPADAHMHMLSDAVRRGEPLSSLSQMNDLITEIVPTIGAGELAASFHHTFDLDAVSFVVTMPEDAEVPTEEQVLTRGLQALGVPARADDDDERPDVLLEKAPKSGKIKKLEEHEASTVTSGWLKNGIRVHHRFVDTREGLATIRITVAGGVIEETSANRGVTEAAMVAVEHPATSTLKSTWIDALTIGKKAGLSGSVRADHLQLSAGGAVEDLEHAMQLAYLVLTDPVVEQTAFDNWIKARRQSVEARGLQPRSKFAEVLADTLYPAGDVRMRPLQMAHLDQLDKDGTELWLRNVFRTAPIEVSVVGDIERDEALALVAQYLGGLPKREPIGETTLDQHREVNRPVGPIASVAVDTETQVAMVAGGLYAPHYEDLRARRLMTLAAQIMSVRMTDVIREEEALVYSIGTYQASNPAFPEFGLVVASAPTKPESAQLLADRIHDLFAEFAEKGPTQVELATIQKQLTLSFEEDLIDPNWWGSHLSTLDYRGGNLDTLVAPQDAYNSFTTAEVHEVFKEYYVEERKFRVVVVPADAEADPDPQ